VQKNPGSRQNIPLVTTQNKKFPKKPPKPMHQNPKRNSHVKHHQTNCSFTKDHQEIPKFFFPHTTKHPSSKSKIHKNQTLTKNLNLHPQNWPPHHQSSQALHIKNVPQGSKQKVKNKDIFANFQSKKFNYISVSKNIRPRIIFSLSSRIREFIFANHKQSEFFTNHFQIKPNHIPRRIISKIFNKNPTIYQYIARNLISITGIFFQKHFFTKKQCIFFRFICPNIHHPNHLTHCSNISYCLFTQVMYKPHNKNCKAPKPQSQHSQFTHQMHSKLRPRRIFSILQSKCPINQYPRLTKLKFNQKSSSNRISAGFPFSQITPQTPSKDRISKILTYQVSHHFTFHGPFHTPNIKFPQQCDIVRIHLQFTFIMFPQIGKN